MFWRKRILGILICCCLICFPRFTYANDILRETANKEKIISVVYDNSGSMIGGYDGKPYVTRWVEANYALKAFAAMMNEGDELRLYLISDFQKSEANPAMRWTVISDKNNAIQWVENETTTKNKFCDNTFFYAVEKAANDFQHDKNRGKDCWLVVIADGVFNKPAHMNASELQNKFSNIVNSGGIRIAYIPIGSKTDTNDAAVQIESDLNIIVPDNENDDIIKKITNILNKIYGRVKVEEANKKESEIEFTPDIPFERMIAFLQFQGKTAEKLTKLQTLPKTITEEKPITSDMTIKAPDYLQENTRVSFEGTSVRPNWTPGWNSGYDPQRVESKILDGSILTLSRSNKNYVEGQNVLIDFNAPTDQNVTTYMEIYYQPAVDIGVEYRQNGQQIEHSQACQDENSDKIERCLEAGELTLELYMVDMDGNRLENQISKLLYPNQLEVIFYPDDENQKAVLLNKVANPYIYSGTLEKGAYTMYVRTPWKTVARRVEIQEKRKTLEIKRVGSDKILIDDASGKKSSVYIEILEDGKPLSTEPEHPVSLTCSTEAENVRVGNIRREENGQYAILLVPDDLHNHALADTAVLHVTATQEYANGRSSIKESDITVEPSSFPHKPAIMISDGQSVKGLTSLWKDTVILCEYECDDEKLRKDQKANVNAVFTVPDNSKWKGLIAFNKDNDLVIKRSLKWLIITTHQIGGEAEILYEKWNTIGGPEKEVITIMYTAVPAGIRWAIYLFIGIMILWIMLCLIKLKTKWHIKKQNAYLKAPESIRPYKLKMNRIGNLLTPWITTVRLSRRKDPYLDGCVLKIRPDTDKNTWILCNYYDFIGRTNFQIGNSAISEDNCEFDSQFRFSVINSKGVRQELIIEDRDT